MKSALFKNVDFEEIKNRKEEEEVKQSSRKSVKLKMEKSTINKIKKLDQIANENDIETARKHGEAKRLLKIDKEALKNSKGKIHKNTQK